MECSHYVLEHNVSVGSMHRPYKEKIMRLHIFGPGFSSLVRSVRLCCLEKGLDATFGMTLNGHSIALRSDEHRVLHPFCQVPVLIHEDRRVFETLSICRYLDHAFPSGVSACLADTMLVDQWASALVSTVDRYVVRGYLLKVAGPRPDPTFGTEALRQARRSVNETLAILEEQLGKKAFLCGTDFTVADALLAPMLDYLSRLPDGDWRVPTVRLDDYLTRIRERPSGLAVLQNPDFAMV
jgi:glutathione S-transferase